MDFSILLGVWSVCLGLASAFFWFSWGSLMPWSFLVWYLGCIFWCPLMLCFWWSCTFLRILFMAYRRRFPTISRLFVIRDRVGDDILDFSYLLIALATLDALCWVVSVMVSLMASRSCSFSNRCLNSCRNSIFFDPIYGYMVLVASSSSIVSFTPLRPVRCCP